MNSVAARAHAFIARHVVAWELAMAGLAVAYVVLGFAEETPAITAAERILTVVFLAEFSGRLAIAPSRTAYLRGHWIDLVALIPATRALRLLRLLRLVRASAGLFRALSQVERLAHHRNLVWLFVIWLTVAVICAIWFYLVEADTNPTLTPLDALYWGIVTLTTVGYGDVLPTTPEGKAAAMVLMVLGISLYSAITATITSILIAGRARPDALSRPDAVSHLERLARLADDGAITPDEFDRAKAMVLR